MKLKRVIIIGTMIVAVSFGGNAWAKPVLAAPVIKWTVPDTDEQDELLGLLNQNSDDELYEALYSGKSLADMAGGKNGNLERVIELQMAELAGQLNERLAAGSITAEQHAVYTAELRDVVTASAKTAFQI
ncbi:hypothetical protein [Paenibacillus sp. NFR01]|uniref:hypothetical protein n=1 Tax=Paenibacillus sp. NFR01 TaxID=1566279 RepID=UPI0008D310CC|nr:hypothetical protein [Paenibacillus sp. NFR01]SEU23500.1 hypothetical protein SAMN03159358_4203 [Paenibacillus sp. NFR01]